MSSGPAKGPVNGGETADKFFARRSAVAEAVDDAALPSDQANAPAQPAAEYPQVAFFAARERPKLHKLMPSVYELMWGVRLGPIAGDGQGVGFSCSQGMSARTLAAALRVCAERLEQIAGHVARGEAVPDFDPSKLPSAQAAASSSPPGGAPPVEAQSATPAADAAGAANDVGAQSTTSPGGSDPEPSA